MARKGKNSFIRMIAENIFHSSEKDRLKTMIETGSRRETHGHPDFLSMAHQETGSEHTHAAEHHGAKYWNYYYEGESPYAVLRGDPIPQHESQTLGKNDEQWNQMLDPDSAARPIDTMGNPRLDYSEQISSEKLWINHMCVADVAMRDGDYTLAQHHLLLAKTEAERWGKDNERLLETERCLESVAARIKVEAS
ncbi:MAG: hypothetical protein JSS83_19715 [Cyanobacteria bacterium SZAS LIN-3]|nr:hypothetical protein [Cyanobacteria bacterium SZAS LIN-3]